MYTENLKYMYKLTNVCKTFLYLLPPVKNYNWDISFLMPSTFMLCNMKGVPAQYIKKTHNTD